MLEVIVLSKALERAYCFTVGSWICCHRVPQSFTKSHFSLIVLFFIPIFLIIWVYFPVIGIEHGRSVAESRIDYYSENLCGDKYDYWSDCIEFSTEHIDFYETPTTIMGRLMLRSGNLVGVFTESGPVTISMPSSYYYLKDFNNSYDSGEEKGIKNQ